MKTAVLPRKVIPVAATRVVAVEPQRSRDGCWTHPHYFIPADNRDAEGPGEFNAWLDSSGLECRICWMAEDASTEHMCTVHRADGNISRWQPEPPPGEGWFVGSLHNTGAGAVCIWLRRVDFLDNASLVSDVTGRF